MIQDIKTQKITSRYLKLGAVMSCIIFFFFLYSVNFQWKQWMVCLVPGIIFLIVAKITKEQIGYGDGLVLFILGICLGGADIWKLCMISIYLSTFYTLIMVVRRKLNRKDRIPYLPFLWISHLLLWGMKYV